MSQATSGTDRLPPTPKQVEGPYFLADAPRRHNLIPAGVTGEPVRIGGQVLGTDGTPINGAKVHVWVADPKGVYDNQLPNGDPIYIPPAKQKLRGYVVTDKKGKYKFNCLRPGNYALDPQRTTWRPSHIHIRMEATGYKTLITQLYFQDDEYNEHDLPGENFFQPELVVQLQPALPEQGTTQRGVFNFVLERA